MPGSVAAAHARTGSDPTPVPAFRGTASRTDHHPPSRLDTARGAVHPPDRSTREDPLATATDVSIKPLEDRVLVTIEDSEQTTASGLVIPDTAKEKPQQGKVIAVGPGKRSDTTGEVIPLDVNEGDTVLFSKYGGTEVKVGGQEYLILSARDILAIVG
jgi:chaperonin GroES